MDSFRGHHKIRMAFLLTALLPLIAGCAGQNLEGIATLNAVGKDEKAQREALLKDDRNFKSVKEAISQKKLNLDLPSTEVAHLYGDPVAVVVQRTGVSRWIYKGQDSGLLSGPKIYLFFDENNRLKNWKCLRTSCSAE